MKLRSFITAATAFTVLTGARAESAEAPAEITVKVTSKQSLVHLGSIDSFGVTPRGKEAARELLSGLNENKLEAIRTARAIYEEIIPKENFGSEYTALAWFCDYQLADDAGKKRILADPRNAAFFEFFGRDNFAPLKEFLERHYRLKTLADTGTDTGRDREALLKDTMLFNNPRRESWEQTSKILSVVPIRQSAAVADIGSGPGYFTYTFSEMVGREGKVYAIDTVEDHLKYVQAYAAKNGLKNIETVNNSNDSILLDADSVDVAFMCSLYHVIYTVSSEDTKDRFVGSIRRALRPDGRLVIVDNALVTDHTLPYHGPHLAKELAIGQLTHYGFDLVASHQFIPQRYILIFKKRP